MAKQTHTMTTLEILKAKVEAEKTTKTQQTTSTKVANDALRGMMLACAAHGAAAPEFTGADMVRIYHGNDLPKGRALVSRTTDWNTVIAAGRKNLALCEQIWPTQEQVEEANKTREKPLRNTTRAAFLKGCVAIKDGKVKSYAEAYPIMHPANSNGGFEMPDLAEANEGDLLEVIRMAGVALYNRHADTFAEFQDGLLSFQSTFNAGRKEGKFRTTEELSKQAPAPVAEMQPIAA